MGEDAEAAGLERRGGSERRDGSKRRGSSVQQGRRTTCLSTPPLSRWSSRRAGYSSWAGVALYLYFTDSDKKALRSACCAAPAAPLLVTAFLLLCSSPFCVNSFWLLSPSPHCFTIPLG